MSTTCPNATASYDCIRWMGTSWWLIPVLLCRTELPRSFRWSRHLGDGSSTPQCQRLCMASLHCALD